MCDGNDHDRDQERQPERPRAEPEIIPPHRNGGRTGGRSHIWISIDERGGARRAYVASPGPLAVVLALVLAGLAAVAILIVLAGALLIWIPLVILVVGAVLLSGYIRHYWRRLQSWATRR